jgi:ribulose-phosphate 3-epimerase
MSIKIAPSIVAGDILNLKSTVDRVKNADYLHFDVMDGVFVPNITIGLEVAKAMQNYTKKPLDIHLMVSNPEVQYIEYTKIKTVDCITFHFEVAQKKSENIIRKIKQTGKKAGISISPKTPISKIKYLLNMVDRILVMSVEPGFSYQNFIDNSLLKIKKLKSLAPKIDIEIDGGINRNNIKDVARAGANIIVAGKGIFGTKDPDAEILELKRLHK